jgi:hypothetical protein
MTEVSMLRHDAMHQNGHAALRMPNRFTRLDVPQPGEFGPMRGISLHHMRLLFIGGDAGPWQHGPHPMGRGSPVIIDQDDNEPMPQAVPSSRMACRRLYPEPGQEVVVAWRDARDLLADQLAHPERLRDTHRLRCHAQVYEALAPQRREALATMVLGDASLASTLQPLTEGLAVRLGLAATIPQWAVQPPQRRDPGVALAGDRFIRLLLDDDPTRGNVVTPAEARDRVPARAPTPQASSLQPAAPVPVAAASSPRRTAIPQSYLRPWEFRRSREEAIYQIHFSTTAGWFRRLLRALRGPSVSRREVVRWQIMLSGKDADAQLWAVRPPIGGFDHPKVREWAARTLALAGYDPVLMLTEWEIYWRRKAE